MESGIVAVLRHNKYCMHSGLPTIVHFEYHNVIIGHRENKWETLNEFIKAAKEEMAYCAGKVTFHNLSDPKEVHVKTIITEYTLSDK